MVSLSTGFRVQGWHWTYFAYAVPQAARNEEIEGFFMGGKDGLFLLLPQIFRIGRRSPPKILYKLDCTPGVFQVAWTGFIICSEVLRSHAIQAWITSSLFHLRRVLSALYVGKHACLLAILHHQYIFPEDCIGAGYIHTS